MKVENGRFLVVLGHFGHMGGAERQAFHLIQYLRKEMQANVAVLGWYETNGPLADTLREWGCEIYSFSYTEKAPRISKAWNLLNLAWFIRSQIRPDFILPFVAVHSKPICQVWRLTGARYAWWNQQDEGRGLHGTNAESKALLNAVHITSNSMAGSEFLSRTYGIPLEYIRTYNNGTVVPDLAGLQPEWRRRLGIMADVPLVVMAANVTPFKDHETLFKAWRLVLDDSREKVANTPVLALAGHTKDSQHVSKLKVMAFDLELGNSVRFLGSVETTDELMWEADLMVHSSVKEGCPNSVCEAMALGKAVVATDIPGTRQALDESIWRNCLVAPGDHDHLAERIVYFLGNEEQTVRVGELNRQRIKNEFSIESMCEFFMNLLGKSSTY